VELRRLRLDVGPCIASLPSPLLDQVQDLGDRRNLRNSLNNKIQDDAHLVAIIVSLVSKWKPLSRFQLLYLAQIEVDDKESGLSVVLDHSSVQPLAHNSISN